MNDHSYDVWLRMYEEQMRHARHHETLRTQATNFVVTLSGGILALVAAVPTAEEWRSTLGIFILLINAYGLLMSLKHYERSRLHVTVGSKYRDVLSVILPIGERQLNDERTIGRKEHRKTFYFVHHLRAYILWSGLHAILGLGGIFVIFKL